MFRNFKHKLWLCLNREFEVIPKQDKEELQNKKQINITKGCCDVCLMPSDIYIYFGRKEVGICNDCLVNFHDKFNKGYDEYIDTLSIKSDEENQVINEIV